MPSRRFFAALLVILTLSYVSASMLRADDVHDLVEQTHGELKLAIDATGDDQKKHLDTAKEILSRLPGGVHRFRGHRKAAVDFIDEALIELSKGDPDAKAHKLMLDADSEVRDIE